MLTTDDILGNAGLKDVTKGVRVFRESISRSIFNPTRTGNGFNKIMSTGNGFNQVIMYILPSKQEREILFEATRTCVWLKLDVCSMRVRFATQQRDTSGLINHQVKYFAKRT